ncbi:MAG: hypothetical protein ACLFTK_13555 [Anaerolineales bacterium]
MLKPIYPQLLMMLILFLVGCATGEDVSPNTNEDNTPRARVNVSEATVFQAPSRDAAVAFRLIQGDTVPVVAQTTSDEFDVVWYQIGQGQRFGWVAGSQVTTSGDLSVVRVVDLSTELPTPTPSPPPATPTPRLVVVPDDDIPARVIVSEGIVFQQPSRDAEQVDRLFEGEIVEVIGRLPSETSGDQFYFVGRNNTVLGWMLAAQLDVQGELSNVPFLEDADVALSTVMPAATDLAQVPTAAPMEESPSPAPTTTPPSASPTATTIPFNPTETPAAVETARAAATATPLEEPTPDGPTPTPGPAQGEPPPLSIDLPAGWQQAHFVVPITTSYLQGALPISLYQGLLPGNSVGSIWLVYGFPNVTSPSGEINLLGDGVQLLRGLLLDPTTCQIGLSDEVREYRVGEREAVGTIYSAVNCANSPDMAGYFAVLQVGGGNFAFFVGVEPPDTVEQALPQMQTILESVEFDEELIE